MRLGRKQLGIILLAFGALFFSTAAPSPITGFTYQQLATASLIAGLLLVFYE